MFAMRNRPFMSVWATFRLSTYAMACAWTVGYGDMYGLGRVGLGLQPDPSRCQVQKT